MNTNDDAETASAAPELTTPAQWLGFLREYSEVFLRTANEYQLAAITADQEDTGWMGREPATEEAVRAAEQRLGVRLPPSYRAFLLASDGFDGLGGWVDAASGCADVAWLRDTGTGASLVDLYADTDYAELFGRALAVAEGEDLWLLDPEGAGPDEEWTAHLFAPKYGELEDCADFADLFRESRELMEELG
ncbi:SMI1/KNR4 family protein [Streptomyces sp. NPDC090306]|uniref:SMI1/KNR4 family protein n=1 Tax=Streptomyces sp. NPDC090306 TaxID=3365961 RepID=UPI00382B250C